MASVQIKLNNEGIKELLKSPEVEAEVKKYADKAVASLGSGYESSSYVGKTRVNASVMAVDYKAKKENLENNTILKAVTG